MVDQSDSPGPGPQKKGPEVPAPPPAPAWPIEGRTLVLARDMRAEPLKDKTQPFKRPPTVDGEVNIGMGTKIHLPSLDQQIDGFTPYRLNAENKPVDATRELQQQFPGTYKRLTEKGDTKNG